ncbi:MAG: zinc dependent phospholipase C family protein [Bacilli bacterium]|nr:zinc dependent phospholipase C family protein [Bacilli bacterium]
MPSWNIHLAIAKEINKKLKLDKNSFYFGNLVPDVDYDMYIKRKDIHYYNVKCSSCPKEILPDLNLFLKDYKKHLSNPIIMGMYIHLLTDYYYNNEIFSKYWVQDINNNILGAKLLNGKITNDKKKYKHYDLELYGKYLFNNKKIEMPKMNKNLLNNMKDVKNNCYSKESIEKRIKYLNKDYINKNKYKLFEKLFGLKYKMISKQELDIMYKNCIEYILINIKNCY